MEAQASAAIAAFAALSATLLGFAAYALSRRERSALERAKAAEFARDAAVDEAKGQRRNIDAFADGLTVAILICDERAVVRYANREAREMFAPEMVGRPILSATLAPEIEGIVKDSCRLKATVEREIALISPRDRVLLAKAWCAPESSGQTYLSLIEITDLRRLERVRRDFVANVSHELRTPMTIIRAYAETLLDDADEELRERYLLKIISEVDRITAISQDLLVLSTSESAPVRKTACDLAAVVRNVVLQLEPRARERGLALRFRGPESAMVEANPAQMSQVALNLVENAIKYAREGPGEDSDVRTIEVDVSADDRGAVLRVTDRGVGIASEHLERIFERFYRVDRARSRATGGTGLGLAIVKHIVEVHGGTIEVESSLNVGTTFLVRLPRGNVDGPGAAAPGAASPGAAAPRAATPASSEPAESTERSPA